MRVREASLLIILSLALSACGRQGSSERAPGSSPATGAAPALNGQPQPSADARDKAPDSGRPLTLTRLNEDGSETVEEVPGDSGMHNTLLAAVASTVAAGP